MAWSARIPPSTMCCSRAASRATASSIPLALAALWRSSWCMAPIAASTLRRSPSRASSPASRFSRRTSSKGQQSQRHQQGTNMRLKDKVAVITGAAQGIGYACAQRFIAEGAKVMMSDINAAKLEESAKRLGAAFEPADAGLKADADRLIRRTIETLGRIDILVSNAGITSLADFLDVSEEEFDRVIRVNLKSQFLCGQAAAREMVRQGEGGVIINMSSVNALFAIADQVAYAA